MSPQMNNMPLDLQHNKQTKKTHTNTIFTPTAGQRTLFCLFQTVHGDRGCWDHSKMC